MVNPARHRKRLLERIKEAERELDAATRPSEIKTAAAKRRRAMEALQWWDQDPARQDKEGGHGQDPQ